MLRTTFASSGSLGSVTISHARCLDAVHTALNTHALIMQGHLLVSTSKARWHDA